MAYIPDKLGERRRKDGVSQTACEFFIKYCEHADQDTGLTFANEKTCAAAFGIRNDNAQKYDRELIDKGWIRLIECDARICRKIEAGWLTRAQRQGKAENTEQGKAENTDILNFRNELNILLNFRKSSYILGEIPKFKEKILNFRNAYKEYIDQPINQQLDHLLDHLEKTAVADSDPAKPAEKPARLAEDFAVTPEMRTWASENAPDVEIEKATREFITFWRDIATRNHRRTRSGWIATWRNRMTDLQEKYEVKHGTNNGANGANGQRKPTPAETYASYGYYADAGS